MTPDEFYRKMSVMNQRRLKNKPVSAGSILHQATAKVFRRRGFGEGDVLTRWPDIVGRELAALTAPEKLQRQRNALAGAILHIRVDGAAALELQHKTPIVLERINAFYGYRAVDGLKLVQGPLPKPEETRERSMRELSQAESTFIERETAPTKNTVLRDALLRLGVSMLRRQDKSLETDDFEN